MKDWITLISLIVGIVGVIVSIYVYIKNKRYSEEQIKAQNYSNRLAHEALRESKKTPTEKKAEELARRGGFSSHAAYLAKQDVGAFREFNVDDEEL